MPGKSVGRSVKRKNGILENKENARRLTDKAPQASGTRWETLCPTSKVHHDKKYSISGKKSNSDKKAFWNSFFRLKITTNTFRPSKPDNLQTKSCESLAKADEPLCPANEVHAYGLLKLEN
uniref:Uncharacterized protein n=1 Tax=Caenorhabditis japonica TaxID=281687 RepID=A0A8R1IHJ8_CAEJA